jgi:hypothetical protein
MLRAQFDFTIDGQPVQVHSFFSQGFAYSNDNNFLTMKTSSSSAAFTDGGVNVSMQVTDRLRIGAQVYDRDIGSLGKWHPQLDWAVADFKLEDWFGIRGGIVKTVFGLENETQDMEFLHTGILLPQSVYPTDLRDAQIRHRGGDLYGKIPLKGLGSLEYTAYAGMRVDSRYGGYPYMLDTLGIYLNSYGGLQVGQDVRWNTPLHGLLVGASHMGADISGTGTWASGTTILPYKEHSKRDWTNQFFGQYAIGNLRVAAEYRRYWRDQSVVNGLAEIDTDIRGWYMSGSYRISKRLELGSYYSRLVNFWWESLGSLGEMNPDQSSPDRHLYDKVVTARVDLNRHWNVKVEGHFMDGYGGLQIYPAGFYKQDNPQGMKPKTNLLLLRTGFSF